MKVDYRSVFVAPKDKLLVSIDLAQAESWVVAYLANERNMKYALKFSDIHCQGTGAILFVTGCGHDWVKGENKCKNCGVVLSKNQRYLGKRYNHATSYGMKSDKAARIINADSDKPPYVTVTSAESEIYHNRWHQYYNVKGWWAEVLSKGHVMTTTYGRTRTFYGIWGDDLEREKIANEPQSTVADHFNGAIHPLIGIPGGLITIYRTLIRPYREHRILNQSHDSCILELPKQSAAQIGIEAQQLLKRPMVIKGEEFIIPTDGKIGDRWDEAQMEKLAA